MKKLVIIGNAKVESDYSSFVNNCNYVARFNWLNNYNENTGTKTDAISLASAKHHIHEFIKPFSLPHKEKLECLINTLNGVNTLIFPIPDANRSCFKRLERIDSLVSFYSLNNKTCKKYFCENRYYDDLKKYGWNPGFVAPSSGYTVIRNILDDEDFKGYRIYLLGFLWEGWEGHPWANEKKVIKHYESLNRLEILW